MHALEMLNINKLRSFPSSAPTRNLDVILDSSVVPLNPIKPIRDVYLPIAFL